KNIGGTHTFPNTFNPSSKLLKTVNQIAPQFQIKFKGGKYYCLRQIVIKVEDQEKKEDTMTKRKDTTTISCIREITGIILVISKRKQDRKKLLPMRR
ncbi:hypothetical protein HHI36_008888, partial [Cryptolaemus montrouzieri]